VMMRKNNAIGATIFRGTPPRVVIECDFAE